MKAISENPFADVGCILSGKRVIGRAQEIRRLRDKLCGKSGFGSIAVVGMPRIGKSSLIQRAIFDEASALAKSKILCIRIDVGTLGSFRGLLAAMVRNTLAEISNLKLNAESLNEYATRALDARQDEDCWQLTHSFFKGLHRVGVRVLCVLDEFDATRRLLHGAQQCFLVLRDLAAAVPSDGKVGLVLVCKRNLAEITELAGLQSGYWHNAMGKELHLRGFDESELDCCFNHLKQAGISLRDDARKELLLLCGTHPYLLDLFAAEAFPLVNDGRTLTRADCRDLVIPQLPKVFSQLVEALKDGPWLGRRKASLFEAKAGPPREALRYLVSSGVLVETPNRGLAPFSTALPGYLCSIENDGDAAAETPAQPNGGTAQHSKHLSNANSQNSPTQPDKAQAAIRTQLVVHRDKLLVEVDGVSFENLSLSQYALIRTMAEQFTLDSIGRLTKNEGIFQTTVITATRANLKKLIAAIWQCSEAERKASTNSSGEWRQLSSGLREKLAKTPNGELLLKILANPQLKKNWVLKINGGSVTFDPPKAV